MKTFKLKSLQVVESKHKDYFYRTIPLIDGLIIDREDDENRWLIEAYTTNDYLDYFNTLKDQAELLVQVKISKETNNPAIFITSVINVTEIGQKLSVLFMGTIVDRQQNNIDTILKRFMEEGYEGKDLLEKLKQIT